MFKNKCKDCNNCGKGCTSSMVMKTILIIGGLNWGLIGLGMLIGSGSDWNIVYMLFGGIPILEAIIYLLVGVSAFGFVSGCKCLKCKDGSVCRNCSVETKTEEEAPAEAVQ